MPAAWIRWTWLTVLLFPLSLVFRAIVAVRRVLYRRGWRKSERLSVPVIIVGNITVGGTGKTPLTLWLVEQLRSAGYTPGIVSRGHGGTNTAPSAVTARDDPAVCGDEPLLLAYRARCPVWIGRRRAHAARALLDANPDCNVIVGDDGLQHYGLARDIEIAVVDGTRGFGNGLMLPAGPLREPVSRLDDVSAVAVRGGGMPGFAFTLHGQALVNLTDPARTAQAAELSGQRVHAVAGIGNPQQFFDTLNMLGITHTPHTFADHHAYRAADLAFKDCDAIVMTEKDAVKCTRFAEAHHWVLPVEARVEGPLLDQVTRQLRLWTANS